jgi:uncharacterized SAM-binding protein YcdF (DUF218 family)
MNVRPARWVVLILLAGIVLGIVTVPRIGPWLIAVDPLARADAIFVTDGKTPHREMEGAMLYREGWAPRVVVTLPRSDISEELRRLSGEPTPQDHSVAMLRRGGVPESAIVRLDRRVENTLEELHVDFDYARAHGWRRVIIVSSPYHLRRIRVIWRSRFEREIPALLRATRYERVETTSWWRSRRSLEDAVHEVAGIAHFLIGSPIPTFDRGD